MSCNPPIKPNCPTTSSCSSNVAGACGPFHLDDSERWLFDSIKQEHTGIVGTSMDFYSQQVQPGEKKRDPLYDEPLVGQWCGPYRVTGFAEWPEPNVEVKEEGLRKTWAAVFYVARKEFEDARAPYPKEGDVVRIWSTPYFDKDASVLHEQIPKSGFYFDITKADDDQHLMDAAYFVGLKLTVARRTEFTPERRISPP